MIKLNPKFFFNRLFLILTLSFSSVSYATLQNKIVAIINNDIITQSEFDTELKLIIDHFNFDPDQIKNPAFKKQVLDKMITEQLQIQEAKHFKITVDDNSVNKVIAEIAKERGLTVAELSRDFSKKGMPFEKFKINIRNELLMSKIHQKELSNEISVSQTDIDNFLKSPQGQDKEGIEYHLAHILIPVNDTSSTSQVDGIKQEALALVKDLKNGADFKKQAVKHSKGQQALSGGDLGWRKIGEVPSLFVPYLHSLNVNEVAGPIQSSNGFHIIKLIAKRQTNKAIVQASRDKAMEMIYKQKMESKHADWVKRLRDQAHIEIFI